MQTATCSEARTQALHPLEQWGVRPEAKAPRVFGLRDDNTEKWVHGDERAEKPNRGQGADPDVSTRRKLPPPLARRNRGRRRWSCSPEAGDRNRGPPSASWSHGGVAEDFLG